MYIPACFEETDRDRIHQVLRRYPFATVLTVADGAIAGSHLPLLLRPREGPNGSLAGHMARANLQWEHFKDAQVLAIFHGPHAYVSPGWYREPQNVPTWNYVAVHAYGVARAYDDPARLLGLVEELAATFESPQPRPWRLHAREEYVQSLLAAIVGFDIEITRLEAKFKLSQNRQPEDREGAARGLSASPDPMGREVAEWMRALGIVPPTP